MSVLSIEEKSPTKKSFLRAWIVAFLCRVLGVSLVLRDFTRAESPSHKGTKSPFKIILKILAQQYLESIRARASDNRTREKETRACMCGDGTLRVRHVRRRFQSRASLSALFFVAVAMSIGSKFVSTAAEDEAPMDHIMETYSGVDATFQESELNTFLKALDTKGTSQQTSSDDDHSGHDHDYSGHDHHHEEEQVATTVLTAAELFREYGATSSATSLNQAEFSESCPELLKCATDATCTFDYGEDDHDHGDENTSKYVKLKAGLAAAVFGESMFGWMIPMVSEALAGRKARWVMSLLNAFSGGVFLSAGLTHLFPHLIEYQEQVKISPSGYPAGFALALTGYLAVFFVERVLFHIHNHSVHSDGHDDHCCETDSKTISGHAQGCGDSLTEEQKKRPYILLGAISVHSCLAGLALGVQKSRNNILTLFTAIAAHKAPAALSIGASFVKGKANRTVSLTSMIFFSLTTTCGIFIGIGLGSVSVETVLVLEALASGTFLYGGTSEIVADEFEMSDKECDEHEGTHSKKVHAGRPFSQRLALFIAYAGGAGIILLSNLATEGEHTH